MNLLELQQYINDLMDTVKQRGLDPEKVQVVSSATVEYGMGCCTTTNTSSNFDIEFHDVYEYRSDGEEHEVANTVVIHISGSEDQTEE